MQTGNFTAFLNALLVINPTNGVLLIGAGNGHGELVEWLIQNQVSAVTLVEPQDAAFKQLEAHISTSISAENQSWTLQKEVVADQPGLVDFYYTSKSTENGLISPELLNHIWPNLALIQKETLSATSLNAFYLDAAQTLNWLMIDCLGALKAIGQAQNLANVDVAIIKVLFNTEGTNTYSDYAAILALFNAQGFDEKYRHSGLHPDIGYVVFVRNYQSQFKEIKQNLSVITSAHEQTLNQLKAEQAAWQDKQQASDEINKIRAEAIQRQQVLIEQLQAQLKALTSAHEQTLNQLKTEQDKLIVQTKENLNSSRLIQLNAQIAVNKQIELRRLRLASSNAANSKANKSSEHFDVKKLADIDLGKAWAGNTVNTVIFRHHAIFTQGELQYTAFYVNETTLRVVQRNLTNKEINISDLPGQYNLRDAHNSISLGIDRAGYLHLSFDHHATQLRYKRSLTPHNIEQWSEDQPMTGQYEDKVTYPTFILPRAGYPLTLLYRDGTHNKGCARLKTYDEKTSSWHDRPTPILAGVEQKPWTSNAYWNHPAIASDGSLHISYVWRTGTVGVEQLVNNINIGYAWSPDNGYSWFTASGQPYNLPITPAVAEVIWPISAGSNLINQCSMALDINDLPHIVFYSNDENGIPQYQHLWFDGKTWRNNYISTRTEAFNLAGGGTLQIPISRPDIVIDKDDNVYVIYRGDITQDHMAVTCLKSPGYAYTPEDTKIITNESVGFSEPIIDRTRWQQEKLLTMLIQFNEQPNHDVGHAHVEQPIRLIDVRF